MTTDAIRAGTDPRASRVSLCNACATDSRTRDQTRPRLATTQKSRPRFSEVGCERKVAARAMKAFTFATVVTVTLLARPGVAQQRGNFTMGRGHAGDLK